MTTRREHWMQGDGDEQAPTPVVGNIPTILYWLNEGAETTTVHHGETITFLQELTNIAKKVDSTLVPMRVRDRAVRIIEAVAGLAESENPRGAAHFASHGMVETAKAYLENTARNVDHDGILATAYLARAIELGAFSELGISSGKVQETPGTFRITRGRMSGKQIGRGDFYLAEDSFSAGMVILARSVARIKRAG